jgi:hypothetical protein
MNSNEEKKLDSLLRHLSSQAMIEEKKIAAGPNRSQVRKSTKRLEREIRKVKDFVKKIAGPGKEAFPYHNPLTCVICKKPLKDLYPEFKDSYGMIDSGVAGKLYAPYGSENDGTVYQIGICDSCIKTTHLTAIGDYMEPEWFEIDKKYRSTSGT